MVDITARHRPAVPAAFGRLMAVESASFIIGAVAHTATRIPLGFATIAEPRIVPATVVETICGISLAVGSYAALARRPWAWTAAVAGHAISVWGVLMGIVALAAGRGPRTTLTVTYQRVILALLVAGLGTLLTRRSARG